MICPDSHRHGENSTCRSQHHCKCEDCREFARTYEFWRAAQKRRGRDLLVDATGAHRRIRALQRLGWSGWRIGEAAGYSESWVLSILRARKIRPVTHKAVAVMYDRLCMTLPPMVTKGDKGSATRARRAAERAGYPGPLAYDDDEIDDPKFEVQIRALERTK